jgi:LacI family transcriptional regulator
MAKRTEIALLVGGSGETGWRYRAGVVSHALPRLNWYILSGQNDLTAIEEMSSHPLSGAIGIFGSDELARAATRLGIPVVNIWGGRPIEGLAQVGMDDLAAGAKAADYLAGLGLEHLTCEGLRAGAGMRMIPVARTRLIGFRRRLRAMGRRIVPIAKPGGAYPPAPAERPQWSDLERIRCRWLAQLPKPVGIFAGDDMTAQVLIESCREIDLDVPQQVAILGCRNDRGHCEGIVPRISSIDLPAERIGAAAAAMLETLLAGQQPLPRVQRIAPGEVVVRDSTRFVASENQHVIDAMRFIRDHAGVALTVDDVAEDAACCRRVLENHFRRELGTTVFKEIRKAQVEHIKHILAETDAPFEQIAYQMGFRSAPHLMTEFKRHAGMTPGAYRKTRPR